MPQIQDYPNATIPLGTLDMFIVAQYDSGGMTYSTKRIPVSGISASIPNLRSGSGAPASGLGNDGDFYIDTTAHSFYGPKVSGAWGSGTSMIGPTGPTGATGPTGPAGVNAFGTPNARTLSLATAYQATDPTRPAFATVNLSSSAAISLTGGTTNTATLVIAATNAVASGTGTVIGRYANSNTGTLTIGLNLNTIYGGAISFALPIGWYFAVLQTSGTVTITSAFDQAVG